MESFIRGTVVLLVLRGCFLINRKLLLCSVTSPRIALAILAEQNAGFALFYGKDPTFLQIDIEKRAGT